MSNAIQASMDSMSLDLSTVRSQLASANSPLAQGIAGSKLLFVPITCSELKCVGRARVDSEDDMCGGWGDCAVRTGDCAVRTRSPIPDLAPLVTLPMRQNGC